MRTCLLIDPPQMEHWPESGYLGSTVINIPKQAGRSAMGWVQAEGFEQGNFHSPFASWGKHTHKKGSQTCTRGTSVCYVVSYVEVLLEESCTCERAFYTMQIISRSCWTWNTEDIFLVGPLTATRLEGKRSIWNTPVKNNFIISIIRSRMLMVAKLQALVCERRPVNTDVTE